MSKPDTQWMNERLGPNFEVLRLLGEGKVSHVFLAREAGLDRLVAIKVLRKELAEDETASRRFDREARSVGRISHPSVASVYRVGELDGVPYLVMQYIEGRTLADTLAGGGRFDQDETVTALAEIAAALAAAHEQRVLHRDVRPGNVIRENRTGRFVLTDFGIAGVLESGSAVTRLTAVGEVLGDPRYLSPEQLRGDPLTESADVYSLAVLGYEMLTGEGPHPSGSLAKMTIAHLNDPPRPLEELRPGTDEGFGRLLARCLAKRPEQRPSASKLSKVLASGAFEDPESAAPTSALGRFLNELRRRKVYRVGAAYLAVAFIILEGSGMILPEMPVPPWTFTLLVAMAVGGFPATLVLSWSYDLTRAGLQRAESWKGDRRGRTKELAIQVGALVLSLVLAVGIGWWILAS